MTESEVRLAILIVAAVIIGSVLAVFACCKVAGDCSRQEEKEKTNEKLSCTGNQSAALGKGAKVKPKCKCNHPNKREFRSEYLDGLPIPEWAWPHCCYCWGGKCAYVGRCKYRDEREICPKCGGELQCDRSVMLTSYPGKYRWECKQCGYFELRVAEV